MNLKGFVNGLLNTIVTVGKEKAPQLLTTLGLGAGVATVVIVAKKAPEAKEKKDEVLKKAEEENYSKGKIAWEVVKAEVPVYGAAIGTGVVAAGCIIGSDIIQNKRLTDTTKQLASATAGYLAVKNQFDNYKETAKEVLGDNKAADLKRKAAERQMQNSEAREENAKELKYTNEGDKQLVYDPYVKDYYKSSIPDMLKVVSKLSIRVQGSMDGYIPFTDWYDEIGYKLTQEERTIYEGFGFIPDLRHPEDCLGFDYTATLSPNDTPCLQVDFNNLVPLWKTREKQRY